MKRNVQRGYIFERHGAWHLRFTVYEDSRRVVKSHRLCAVDAEHPSKESVRPLADGLMEKVVEGNKAVGERGHKCPICGNRCARNTQGKFVPRGVVA